MSRESMSPNPSPVVPVYRSFDAVPRDFGPSTAVIGNFDGVHRGHQQILGAAAAEARSRGMRSIAITFQPHPAQFLYPQDAPRLLTFLPERLKLLATTGVDAILVLDFDEVLSRVTAEDFVRNFLVGVSAGPWHSRRQQLPFRTRCEGRRERTARIWRGVWI